MNNPQVALDYILGFHIPVPFRKEILQIGGTWYFRLEQRQNNGMRLGEPW